ncbi:hypothetical protein CSV78_04045 [Sporosarcina sp. P16a]|uniref:hypothetical protein n=1 Tax=unclassified Sporosarcina TaxID=2647733 RepID=UPI000C163D69|nr:MULTISPECIES: hypothetical protein [unclassified Sporosarcina]PIC67972.1 hypothetical protein CSV78_04045 [Sporosarcina sp. P16a]PIC94281.1 hypothetical protein CSV70_00685 [Sporosarcina sp. P25]
MKKKLKIFLLAIVALIMLGGGYLLYIFQFKEYEVADEEVDEIIENPYDIILPNGTKLVLEGEEQDGDQNTEQTSDSKSDNGDENSDGSTSTAAGDKNTSSSTAGSTSTGQVDSAKQPAKENVGSTTGTTTSTGDQSGKKDPAGSQAASGNAGSNQPAKKDSVAAIKQKYEPTVNNLQGQVDGKINSLISRAKNEYSTKKANGESIDYGYFYNKYMSAANSLESQTDAVFNGVVSSLEKDLQANGYDKSYSQSIRDEYAAQKKARRDSIMSKAMGR